MAMVMGSVHDERCFSNMGFMNNKLRNILTTHLDLVVKLFTQKFFTFNSFPFATTMNAWNATKSYHTTTKV
jgi:nitrate reductase gamma subunit